MQIFTYFYICTIELIKYYGKQTTHPVKNNNRIP
jgi:hypothetical protein